MKKVVRFIIAATLTTMLVASVASAANGKKKLISATKKGG